MFGNLVKIELIRLFKSSSFKVCGIGGIVLTMAYIFMNIYMNRRDLFLSSIIFTAVALITVICVTCDYQSLRLGVNIEGAVRGHFKLCASEITGITIFIAIINLSIFPIALLMYVTKLNEGLLLFKGPEFMIVRLYLVITLISIYINIIGFLFSKVTGRITAAAAGALFIFILITAVIYLHVPLLIGACLFLPVIILLLLLYRKYKGADRI